MFLWILEHAALHPDQFNAETSPYAQEFTFPPFLQPSSSHPSLLQGELRAGASQLLFGMPQNLSVGPISTRDAFDSMFLDHFLRI